MKNILFILILLSQFTWAQTKISDGVLKSSVNGSEKIPVSGTGHPVINSNRIYTYMKARMDSVYQTIITNLAANKGGTGHNLYTIGDLLYASSGSNLHKQKILQL